MNTKNDLSTLPRSIRWRLQLGLLKDCHGGNLSSTAMTQEDYLRKLALQNDSIVRNQRAVYEKLAEKHHRQSSALAIISATETSSPLESSPAIAAKSEPVATNRNAKVKHRTADKPSAKKPVKVVVDDPLSIMASMEEKKVKIDKKRELERKRELALASRPHMTHHPSSAHGAASSTKSAVPSKQGNTSEIGTKTIWDEFYSSREIMDIIDKDIDRLPIDHHIYFHQRKTNDVISIDDEEWNPDNPNTMKSRKERSKVLSEILFVYAKEHYVGYRQGMHEILSFLFMVIEIDIMNLSRQSGGALVSDACIKRCLLNESKLAHDAYCMFDAVMSSLSSAFEYGSETETMGNSTIHIIRDWHGDDELADFVSNLDVPPELYCTRWIRLMFSREVAGLDNVFVLWDGFFHELTNSMMLMKVLETCAASMIILIQDKLLPHLPDHQGGSVYNQYDMDGGDDHEAIHLLMNYSQIEDITPLIDTFQKLVATQRSGIKPNKIQRVQNGFMFPQNQQMYPVEQPPEMNDNMYFSQGPVDYSYMLPHVNVQTQNQPMPHQDQLMTTLKNLKSNPALQRTLSNGLNAVKGALQQIDNSLKAGSVSGASDNIYQPTSVAPPTNDPPQPKNDGFLGYRDYSTLPSIIDEELNVPQRITSDEVINGVATEGNFVGGTNVATKPSLEQPLPRQSSADPSEEIAERMGNSISKITNYLQNAPNSVPNSNSNDVWFALSELENIRMELVTKYQVSPRKRTK